MNLLSLSQIAEFAGASLSSGHGNVTVERVSTDSRTVKRGELFVAISGENFDGHRFVAEAAKAGAAGAMVASTWKGEVPKNFALLRVADTLRGYQDLAANSVNRSRSKCSGLPAATAKPAPRILPPPFWAGAFV